MITTITWGVTVASVDVLAKQHRIYRFTEEQVQHPDPIIDTSDWREIIGFC